MLYSRQSQALAYVTPVVIVFTSFVHIHAGIEEFILSIGQCSNCHGDICQGNICPGDMGLYQEYLSC